MLILCLKEEEKLVEDNLLSASPPQLRVVLEPEGFYGIVTHKKMVSEGVHPFTLLPPPQ